MILTPVWSRSAIRVSSHIRRSCREFKQQQELLQPQILELILSSNSHMTHMPCFFPLAMVMPMPYFHVFHWPQFTPMHCLFFISYCFTPTYCMCSDNHAVNFLHGQMYPSKHPLCSTTSSGQGDILVLTLLILSTARCIYHNIHRPTTPAGHSDILLLTFFDFINSWICPSITFAGSTRLQVMGIY